MNNDTFAILEQRTDKHGRAAWFLADVAADGSVVLHVSRESARARVVELLESIGTACFDDEELTDLQDCLIESVESGDIDESDL